MSASAMQGNHNNISANTWKFNYVVT